MIRPDDIILFQGDSITDTGRDRTLESEPQRTEQFGRGYAQIASGRLLARYPQHNLTIYNRGQSGNRIVDLYARWKIDAINLRPTLLSILIGINDTWHGFKRDNGVEIDRFERFYHEILTWTRKELPDTRLILCEPFCLRCGTVTADWVPDVDARRRVVHSLAGEFNAPLVRFQDLFDAAAKEAPPEYWAADGVHPTLAGHSRMADAWLGVADQAG